jgi:D-3-phosphoglycerate dehydrogenase
MTDPVVEGLIVDLLLWLANGERTYEEVMDAWRTSCPRLPVWEEANDRGLLTRERVNGLTMIKASTSGLALLEQRGLGQRTSVSQTRARADGAQFEQAQ